MMVARSGNGLGDIPRHTDRKKPKYLRPLTERQAQVLTLHDAGHGPTAIARTLGIKRPQTVETILTAALNKVGRFK